MNAQHAAAAALPDSQLIARRFAALPAETLDMLMADPALLTRVLQYHVVMPAMGSNEIVAGDVATAAGDTIAVAVAEDGTITVNGANILQALAGGFHDLFFVSNGLS